MRLMTYNIYGELESESLTTDGSTYRMGEHIDSCGRRAGYRLANDAQDIQNTQIAYDDCGRIASLSLDGGRGAVYLVLCCCQRICGRA